MAATSCRTSSETAERVSYVRRRGHLWRASRRNRSAHSQTSSPSALAAPISALAWSRRPPARTTPAPCAFTLLPTSTLPTSTPCCPQLDPATMLVVVISKTFTTVETLANASAARDWLRAAVGPTGLANHLCAVTADVDAAGEFGVPPDAVFGFATGSADASHCRQLSVLALSSRSAQQHAASCVTACARSTRPSSRDAPAGNAAVLLGMLDFWYTEYLGVTTKAIVPYSQDLALLPAHLQQLQMESNGKSVTADGHTVSWPTSPVVWGAPGTNGQHAFFQLLHQGTTRGPRRPDRRSIDTRQRRAHDLLQANLLAQAAALALGRTAAELRGVRSARQT